MNSHQTQIPVYADLDELCAERMCAVIVRCAHPIDFASAGHLLESVSVQDCGVAFAFRWRMFEKKFALFHSNCLNAIARQG